MRSFETLTELLHRCDLELARIAETPGTWPAQSGQLKRERDHLLAELADATNGGQDDPRGARAGTNPEPG
jgi:hypothetical protein